MPSSSSGSSSSSKTKSKSSSSHKKDKFFTYKDLSSDYYQTLIEEGRPKWCKIIWLLLSLVLLGTTTYLIYKLVKSYLEYKSFNKISVKWEKSVALPALTICSINYVNFTAFKEDISDESDLKDTLQEFLQAMEQYDGKTTGGIGEAIDKEAVKKLDSTMKDKYGIEVSIFDDYQFEPDSYLLGKTNLEFSIIFRKLKLINKVNKCIMCDFL